MAGGPMDWWYWFGMWIALISGVILTWWVGLDAFRRRGSVSRFAWPVVAFTGLILQVPAFTVRGPSQAETVGTAAAAAGIVGLVLVGISTIAYFSRSSSGGGTWFTRTRDNDSALSGSHERRSRSASARASVPLSARQRGPRTPTPVDFSDESGPVSAGSLTPRTLPQSYPAAVANTSGAVGEFRPDTDATIIASDETGSTVMDDGAIGATGETDKTVMAEDDTTVHDGLPSVASPMTAGVAAASATIMAEDEPTVAQEKSVTLHDTLEDTVIDDVEKDVTVSDDPTFATIIEDSDGPGGRIVITDGRSSRIVITERSGPFIVGRDMARSNLAVDDAKVSRTHFAVSRVDEEYVISDLDSSNGTFVNGEMLRDARILEDGDTIEFGRTVAKFLLDGEAVNG